MEFFLKHKTVILRSLGAMMLVLSFGIHFWATPKKVLTQNDIAAANVARMEAKVNGVSNGVKDAKHEHSKFMDKLKNTQEKQVQYMTIFSMVLGVLFLGYSFVKKDED